MSREDLIKIAKDLYGDKFDYSNVPHYMRSTEEILIGCKKHGDFKRKVYLFIQGHNCRKCQNEKRRLSTNEFIKRAINKHGDKFDYSMVDYKGGLEPIEIICKKHGSFIQIPENHISGSGCPFCNESSGEREISIILKNLSIKFERNKKFKDCISDKRKELPFDFYLPDYNLCIEYDGRQHFEPVSYFGGDIKFNRQKHLDSIKDKYCKDNDIKLLRIDYKVRGYSNLYKLLSEYLNKYKFKYLKEYDFFNF
jgi:hypothetical protein